MANSIDAMLLALIEQTEAKRVRWSSTAAETAFRIGLGGGLVTVSHVSPSGHEAYTVRIRNSEGVIVYENYGDADPHDASDHAPFEHLRRLFIAARASALGIDELVDSMQKALAQGRFDRIPDAGPFDDDISF